MDIAITRKTQSILETNPLKQGALTEHSEVIGTVTRKMMRERAVELAVSSDHSAEGVSKSDWEQAKQELMGERNSLPKISSGPGDSSENIEAKLKDHPFLKGLKPEHLAILGRHARMAEFSAGKMVFHQDEHAHQFYLILDGRVAVESYVERADSIPLQIVGAGDVLGWSWLFPPFTWHFQARSLEATKAIFLDGASLLATCEEDHSFGHEVMQRVAKVVVSRLETTQKRFSEIQTIRALYPDITEQRHNNVVGHVVEKSLEEMLATHPFFEGMRSEHLGILADSAMQSHFDAGQVIFREGDPANRFYLIQHGKVVLEAAGREKSPAPFQIIGDGDVLGWSWLLPPFYSHFEARALEPTQSIFLYATRLRDVCQQNHELGYALLKRTVAVVIQRLQATRERWLELTEKSPSVARKSTNSKRLEPLNGPRIIV